MNSSWHASPDHLQSILAGIWTIKTDAATDLNATVLPDGTPYLVFQKDGTRLHSSDNAGQRWASCSVSGPRSTRFDVCLQPSSQIFIVQLSSTGGVPVLGLPMSEIAGQCIDLDCVSDASFDLSRLSDRLMDEPDDVRCIALLQDWVARQAAEYDGGPSEYDGGPAERVVRAVRAQHGNCEVAGLAADLQVSRRHLSRVMQRDVGLSTKAFARIMRFDRAVQLARLRPERRLVDIAAAAGYADQAHMNREFSALGGVRPTDLQSERGALIW